MRGNALTIKNSEDNPGIIFEKIEPLRISTTNWKMIYNIDLKPYRADEKFIQQEIEEALRKCKTECRQFNRLQRKIKSDIENLQDALQPARKIKIRAKRGAPLGFMGQLGHFLFGVLAENEQRELVELIQGNANQTSRVAQLMAEQTEIVKV